MIMASICVRIVYHLHRVFKCGYDR